ncbi:hypothetical protein J4221_00025 [Candidatus Pacearchaeota archaeon]|nr:hypothetical protein [Candidatus Pacearchaeota archaeon]
MTEKYPNWNYKVEKIYPLPRKAEYSNILNVSIGYPRSLEVTVEEGRERTFNAETTFTPLTDSQRRLFTLGADRVVVDGIFGRKAYRKTRDEAYSAADGTPQRTLAYVVEEKK